MPFFDIVSKKYYMFRYSKIYNLKLSFKFAIFGIHLYLKLFLFKNKIYRAKERIDQELKINNKASTSEEKK